MAAPVRQSGILAYLKRPSNDQEVQSVVGDTGDNVSDPEVLGPEPTAKRRAVRGRFLTSWQTTVGEHFTYDDVSNTVTCEICRRASAKDDFAVGKKCPDKGWKKEYLQRHNTRATHIAATRQPTLIKEAEASVRNAQRVGGAKVIPLIRNVLFLCQENISVFKAKKLHRLLEIQGIEIDQNHRGKNYAWEFVSSLSDVKEQEILAELKKARFYTLIADESTDISTTKNLMLYVKYRYQVSELNINLQHRFPDTAFVNNFDIFVPALFPEERSVLYGVDQIEELYRRYRTLLPAEDLETISDEWDDLKYCLKESYLNCSQEEFCLDLTVDPVKRQQYPNMAILAEMCLVMAASSAEVERGFSQTNLIKTKQRNRLSAQHLDMLLRVKLCYTGLQSLDATKVYNNWLQAKRRRLIFDNPHSSDSESDMDC
ncbi:uncharacterized protein [Ptychodera flava]|uniref:uncharacterized protein n=1 Tax=Ptychodera flava TaxID=63121 RepID=UPI003969BD87